MNLRVRAIALIAGVALLPAGHCSPTEEASDGGGADGATPHDGASATDAGTGATVACYVADQFRCKELPSASEAQKANLPVECSSVSGIFGSTCPTQGYGGKCTVAAEPGTKDGPEVRRFYVGRDLAYEQDFCVNTAKGVWSTAF